MVMDVGSMFTDSGAASDSRVVCGRLSVSCWITFSFVEYIGDFQDVNV